MNRKLTDRREDLLGVSSNGSASAATPRQDKDGDAIPAEKGDRRSGRGGEREAASLAGLLSQFMEKLRDLAKEADGQPGGWKISLPDSSLLRKLGDDAAMEPSALAPLLEQLEVHGKVALPDLFAALADQFELMSQPQPVIIAETDLPFIEMLLQKMGTAPEQAEAIASDALIGEGQVDLAKLLAGLENLEAGSVGEPVSLTRWETEQLENLLAEAGLTRERQQALLGKESFAQRRQEMLLGLGQLRGMLRDGLADVEAARPQVDLAAFFADLDEILARAAFEAERVGWSPAVQEAVDSIYRKLLESVDLATVRAETVDQAASRLRARQLETDQTTDEEPTGEADLLSATSEAEEGAAGPSLAENDEPSVDPRENGLTGMLRQEAKTSGSAGPEIILEPPHLSEQAADGIKTAATPRLAPELQQQALEQITRGVAAGLRHGEHHFVLKLHPRELGEVKVEMLMQDDRISLSFTTENSRVKEMLESQLGQFRDNLARQGFMLGECMVSVGGEQGEAQEAWQRFVTAWKERQSAGGQENGRPEEALHRYSLLRPLREGGIYYIA